VGGVFAGGSLLGVLVMAGLESHGELLLAGEGLAAARDGNRGVLVYFQTVGRLE
jgi:hypothetical protein